VPTAFPAILEGIGMTCREIDVGDLGSAYVELGRALRDVLGWILDITP
jgi:hypothetical protein